MAREKLSDLHIKVLKDIIVRSKGWMLVTTLESLAEEVKLEPNTLMSILADLQNRGLLSIEQGLSEEVVYLRYAWEVTKLDAALSSQEMSAKEYYLIKGKILEEARKELSSPLLIKQLDISYNDAKSSFSYILSSLDSDGPAENLSIHVLTLDLYLTRVLNGIPRGSGSGDVRGTLVKSLDFLYPEAIEVRRVKAISAREASQIKKLEEELELVEVRIQIEGERDELVRARDSLKRTLEELKKKSGKIKIVHEVVSSSLKTLDRLKEGADKICAKLDSDEYCAYFSDAIEKAYQLFNYISTGNLPARSVRTVCTLCPFYLAEFNLCLRYRKTVNPESPPCVVT